jgi:hypothetical protein
MSQKASEFTRHKFEWLEAVAKDGRVRGWLLAVAVVLASRYLNSETRDAWPAVETLALACGTDRRTAQRALRKLIRCGWLHVVSGGVGRANTNRYAMRLVQRKGGTGAPASDDERAAYTARKGGIDVPIRAALVPPEPKSNPGGNPREGADAPNAAGAALPLAPDFTSAEDNRDRLPPLRDKNPSRRGKPLSGSALSGRRRAEPLPEDWVAGPNEIAAAQRATNWDEDRITAEFAAFLDWHRAKRPFSHDWIASWTNWCRRGASFDSKSTGRPMTGLRSAVVGLTEWLEQEREREKSSKH